MIIALVMTKAAVQEYLTGAGDDRQRSQACNKNILLQGRPLYA
jgi:hypothetical protein